MPPPLDAVAAIARLSDRALSCEVDLGEHKVPLRSVLYDLLRGEQDLAVRHRLQRRTEISAILDLAQAAYGELVGVLAGRADELLDSARDGEWSLRDLLRHAIAVELRYAAQVEYAATRRDADPLAIPNERLPCDRLAPPEPDFADSRSAGPTRMLELVGEARARSDRRLAGLPDAAMERPSLWGTLRMTVRMRSHQIAAHLTEVILQSEKMLGVDARGSEARHVVRRCCAMRGAHELRSDGGARADLDARYRSLAASS